MTRHNRRARRDAARHGAAAPHEAARQDATDISIANAKARAAAALERMTANADEVLQNRLDRWMNAQTGLGTVKDKTRAGHFEHPFRLMDAEITALMNGSALAAKVVEKRPTEAFRRGYEIESAKTGDVDKSDAAALHKFATEDLEADEMLRQGMTFGREYGGALLILGINDGRMPWEPVDEQNIESIDYINIVDRRFAYVQTYYSDYTQPRYGRAQQYLIANAVATASFRSPEGNFGYRKTAPPTDTQSWVPGRRSKQQRQGRAVTGYSVLNVHESRVIRFDGVETDVITRQTLAGWSWSVLQRVYESLRQTDQSFDALCYLISDASQGVLEMKGLMNAITGGNEGKVAARLEMIEQSRSVARLIALDQQSGEKFHREATPLTGIPESIDRMMQRFAADADMPIEEIFGLAPGGLASAGAGESSRVKWYATIASEQTNSLGPKIKRLYRYIGLARNSPLKGRDVDWKVNFHPLYAPTDDEVATTRLKNAQRDQIYITTEAVPPEKVALTLTDIYSSIDPEELEESIEAKTKFDPHENDPIASQEAQAEAAKKPPTIIKLPPKQETPVGGGENGSLREGQSPTVPLPGGGGAGSLAAPAGEGGGTPSDPGTGNPKARARDSAQWSRWDRTRRSDALAEAVYDQLAEDFPEPAVQWVKDKDTKWSGPVRVDPTRIDYSGKEKWRAFHDPVKVALHKKRIQEGAEKPIVLVKRPGSKKLKVVDGHHRSLGYLELDTPALAYVAEVRTRTGPWDEMHALQKEGLYESTQVQHGKLDVVDRALPDAAIVIVRNKRGEVLTVTRPEPPHEFAVPGGEIDAGETPEAAARRELAEETGIELASITPSTTMTSPLDGRTVHVFTGIAQPGGIAAAMEPGFKVAWMTPAAMLAQHGIFAKMIEPLLRDETLPHQDDGTFTLPPDHQFGMAVPAGGSSCAKCQYLSQDGRHCDNRFFQAWRRSLPTVQDPTELPADAARYCCDVFEPRDDAGGDGGRKDFDPDQPRETGAWTGLGSNEAHAATELAQQDGTQEHHHAAAMAHMAASTAHMNEARRRLVMAVDTTKPRDERLRHRAAHERHASISTQHMAAARDHMTARPTPRRADEFDESKVERDPAGRFAPTGGGSGAASGGQRHLLERAGHAVVRNAIGKAVQAIRGAPAVVGRAVMHEVKEKIHDAKEAFHGVVHALSGKPISHEEKVAIRHVAIAVATSILAAHLAPLLPVGALAHGFLSEGVVEKIGHHVIDTVLEKLTTAGVHRLNIDAATGVDDPEGWLAEQVATALADALDRIDDDKLAELLGAEHQDFNPDQDRDERGRFGSGGGGSGGIARTLTERAIKSGGFSYRAKTPAPRTGYMVSLPTRAGVNHVVDIKALAAQHATLSSLKTEVAKNVRAWMDKSKDAIAAPEHYLGGWVQKDDAGHPVALHLDVSQRFTDRNEAVKAGAERNQLAVWHLDESREIPTGGTGT